MTARDGNIVPFPSAARDENLGRQLIPGRLYEARLAKRLNQTELADKVGLSRQAISAFEQGAKSPEAATLVNLARQLEQPVAYFTGVEPESFGEIRAKFFRKVGPDTKRRNMACEVLAKWLVNVSCLFDGMVNYPNVNIPVYSPEDEISSSYSDMEIENIATEVRKNFGLGLGPISNVVRLLETQGVIVSRFQLQGESVEAFSFWSGDRPFVFLASDKESGARARYDAAHELGHLVLHRWVSKDEIENKDRLKKIENEADRFASAFLLPKETFLNEIYSPRLANFVSLKDRWKVSIQAMIYRCKHLGIFDEQQITSLYKQISSRGWRKKEPLDGLGGIKIEDPMLLRRVIEVAIDGGRIGRDNVKVALGFSQSVIEQLANLPSGYLSISPPTEFLPTLK
ncbi:helix-turn-helix domain-containing protein [Radicibacter daui]|uniref:helix-turn-helix domain-containing protein n=1 Tax=Radicibacter daui TaxID=3064829 RepID=UPI004046DEF6